MTKLSVAIVAHNEGEKIASCLNSVNWADEIVVLDGHSADNTAKIAKKMGARVYSVENQPLMKINMNLSFEKCTGDWILSLDAEESVTQELKEEILKTIRDPQHIAYQIPRKNIIFGKWIAHSFWYPDYQLRLLQRGKAKFPARNVHEELIVDGTVGQLQSALEHYNYDTVSQWIGKLDSYTTYEAGKLVADGKQLVWSDAVKFPFSEFLTRFFAQDGYKDGLHGLVLALLQAFYWEVVFAKVWEREKFWQYGDDHFLDQVQQEGREVSRQWHHWLTVSQTDLLKKNVYKIRNKLRQIL